MSFEWVSGASVKVNRKTTLHKLYRLIVSTLSSDFAGLNRLGDSTKAQYKKRLERFLEVYSSIPPFIATAEGCFERGISNEQWHTIRGQLHVIRLVCRLHYNDPGLNKTVLDELIDLADDYDVTTSEAREIKHAREVVVSVEEFRQLASRAYEEGTITLRMYCIALIYGDVPLRDDLQVTWQHSIDSDGGNTNYLSTHGATVWLHVLRTKTIPVRYEARTYTLSDLTSRMILQYVAEKEIDSGEFVFGRNSLSDDVKELLGRLSIDCPGGGINYLRRMHRTTAVASGNRRYVAAVRRASAHSAIAARGYTSQLNSRPAKVARNDVEWG